MPVYLDWHKNRKKFRLVCICLEGLLAGFLAGSLDDSPPRQRRARRCHYPISQMNSSNRVGKVNAVFAYILVIDGEK
jgi:hypothetical protein